MAGASAPSPRARLASNWTWPASSGALARQHLVAAREQPNLDRRPSPGASQRMHEGMHAVVAGECGEAEIGNDEPLRRQRIELVAGAPAGCATMT